MLPPPEAPDISFSAICGDQFASGKHRTVHDVIGHPDVVVKVATHSTYANWHEFFISSALQCRPGPVADIVGEVKSTSASGHYLIMERLPDISNTNTVIRYPSWATDLQRVNFGMTSGGSARLRDFGHSKIGMNLAQSTFAFENNSPSARAHIVPDGHDADYEKLLGSLIRSEQDRTIHEVTGHPDLVVKRCTDSHRANQAELFVFHALQQNDADILDNFGVLACSRSGKYLIMERLSDLPNHWTGSRPQLPVWLKDKSNTCLGMNVAGAVKIRTYKEIDIVDALTHTPVFTRV
ncbi:hypothetical protein [Paraburkholderia silvatlantica]|uniref:Uncharacterized protein n=1 Tax=Paraburkholderia silvatlantica TaxID=321895 RepID=A0ABR6FY05_9BURK|nr:hypothetical protein [Paraburkholderia silvatlantica]MBB2931997.1 hypothetical protein [Paraburkholderia silvatlantica]PVY24672.1 hypothetical protein C7411_12761 [Paraburkholderia silvatlantica]PXW31168.1 hypothetical protein C7413_12661 [Paraburkholderia silvatlantica]